MTNLKRIAEKIAAAFWNYLGGIVDKRRPRVALKVTSDQRAVLTFFEADRLNVPLGTASIPGAVASISDTHGNIVEDASNPGQYIATRLPEDEGQTERVMTVSLTAPDGKIGTIDLDFVPGAAATVVVNGTAVPVTP